MVAFVLFQTHATVQLLDNRCKRVYPGKTPFYTTWIWSCILAEPHCNLLFEWFSYYMYWSVHIRVHKHFFSPTMESPYCVQQSYWQWVSFWKTLNSGVIPAKHNFEVCRTIEGVETIFILLIWHHNLLRNSDDEGKRKIMKLGIHKVNKLDVFR